MAQIPGYKAAEKPRRSLWRRLRRPLITLLALLAAAGIALGWWLLRTPETDDQGTPDQLLLSMYCALRAKQFDRYCTYVDPECRQPIRALIAAQRQAQQAREKAASEVKKQFGRAEAAKIRSLPVPTAAEMCDLLPPGTSCYWWQLRGLPRVQASEELCRIDLPGNGPRLYVRRVGQKWYALPLAAAGGQGAERLKAEVATLEKWLRHVREALDTLRERAANGSIPRENFEEQYERLMANAAIRLLQTPEQALPEARPPGEEVLPPQRESGPAEK